MDRLSVNLLDSPHLGAKTAVVVEMQPAVPGRGAVEAEFERLGARTENRSTAYRESPCGHGGSRPSGGHGRTLPISPTTLVPDILPVPARCRAGPCRARGSPHRPGGGGWPPPGDRRRASISFMSARQAASSHTAPGPSSSWVSQGRMRQGPRRSVCMGMPASTMGCSSVVVARQAEQRAGVELAQDVQAATVGLDQGVVGDVPRRQERRRLAFAGCRKQAPIAAFRWCPCRAGASVRFRGDAGR